MLHCMHIVILTMKGNVVLGERGFCIPVENFLGILLLPVYCYFKAVTTVVAIIIVHSVNLHTETKTVFAGKYNNNIFSIIIM